MEQVDFAGNDYLGLAGDRRLAEVICLAAEKYGISATSSRWALGWTDIHQNLEEELADFLGFEEACILGAAYFGGPVYYTTTYRQGGTVFCDKLCHSNQYLGMRAAGFEILNYKHLDLLDLERKLADFEGGTPLLATDGVFGISGELAPLKALYDKASLLNTELFIDDAHGVFVLGEEGRGSVEEHQLPRERITLLGSMSKAMGVNGGFLASSRILVEQFRRSPAASGSAIPPPPIAAACLEALRIIRLEPERRRKMWKHAEST